MIPGLYLLSCQSAHTYFNIELLLNSTVSYLHVDSILFFVHRRACHTLSIEEVAPEKQVQYDDNSIESFENLFHREKFFNY